jgi:endogenous inhibitor of DNA gyrase (YacG/DUF329 family)
MAGSRQSHEGAAPEPCPICRRKSLPRLRPFCSERCADVDLGRWLTDAYAVPAEDGDEDDGGPILLPGIAGQTGED